MELIVSVALFSTIMVIITGALLTIVDANRKSLAQQVVITNLNFALESISRVVRVGTTYHCDYTAGTITVPRDCLTGSSSFAFESNDGDSANSNDQRVFRLNGVTGQIERSTDSGANWVPITAPEITITRLTFFVVGADSSSETGGALQPRVIVVVTGYSNVSERSRFDFNLNTMISQRVLDL